MGCFNIERDSMETVALYFVNITSVVDILRYISVFFVIAVIRIYFKSFKNQIIRFRDKYDIISRSPMKYYNSYINFKTSNRIDIDSNVFINHLECILFKYRRLCNHFRSLISIYLFLNVTGFILIVFSTILGPFVSRDTNCNKMVYFLIHYIIEMLTFFVGWILLVIPLCENHILLENLSNDFKSKIRMNNLLHKIIIHDYFDSLLIYSPFAIKDIQPKYSKLVIMLYVIIFTVGFQIINLMDNIYGVF